MRLVCRDCGSFLIVQNESLTQCPQCGSENIETRLINSARRQEPTIFECKDCGFGIKVKDKQFKVCPQCGSSNIGISSISSTSRQEGKSINSTFGSDIWCCLCEILVPLIGFLIIYLVFIGSV